MHCHAGPLMEFLFLLSVFGSWRQVTSCSSSSDGTYVTCKGQNLNDVPGNFSEDLQYLDLSYNQITEITVNAFSQYAKLQRLNLSYNNISSIKNGSFQNNLLLRNLSLFNNSLVEIPSSSLEQLVNLQILDLSNNLYTSVALGDVFAQLVNLQYLSIGGNLVSSILKQDFAPIRNITLQKFSLKTKSSLYYYEPGAFSVLNTQVLWFDIALDNNTILLSDMLKDLAGKSIVSLRFRNLFEFSYYEGTTDIFSFLPDIVLTELQFYRGKFNDNLLRCALQNIEKSTVSSLLLVSIDFGHSLNTNKTNVIIDNLALNNLVIQDITETDFLRFDSTFTWFSKIINLSIMNVNFNIVPCNAWGQMSNVVTLNLSNNRLLDLYNLMCKNISLPKVTTLNLSKNQIQSLRTVSRLTANWLNLTDLDLAYNHIGLLNETCVWTPSIKNLILRHNTLTIDIFSCLPISLEYLDMSNTQLEELDMNYFNQASSLTELILSNNKIKFIPTDWQSPNLQVLALDGNLFGVIDKGSFSQLSHLKQLTAGNNPYRCNCELSVFITDTITSGSLLVPDWPDNYYCYHPPQLVDTKIEYYSPGALQCDINLVVAISVSVTAFVLIILMVLCWRFDVPWYLKATCEIIQSKYRSRKNQETREFAYHAFISYSYSDADWVRDVLLPQLENANPPYRLCIHERDFLPGKWIIDNIIENIENSSKIMFVLSRNFINSDWCNYELYFAHQRAIGHAFSDVILVVKESVSMKDLPKKFSRLRTLLNTKTYLEWPLEESRQPFFWIQLKSILGKGCSVAAGQENFSLVDRTVDAEQDGKLGVSNFFVVDI